MENVPNGELLRLLKQGENATTDEQVALLTEYYKRVGKLPQESEELAND